MGKKRVRDSVSYYNVLQRSTCATTSAYYIDMAIFSKK